MLGQPLALCVVAAQPHQGGTNDNQNNGHRRGRHQVEQLQDSGDTDNNRSETEQE
jgi:hypothetical protein